MYVGIKFIHRATATIICQNARTATSFTVGNFEMFTDSLFRARLFYNFVIVSFSTVAINISEYFTTNVLGAHILTCCT